MKKLIIIPAYNEEKNIVGVVKNVKKYAPDFDYIVVNDCSTDNTIKVCKENNIEVISLPVNLGIGGAVQTGFIYAYRNNYDIAVQLDGDGQHNPRYLNKLVEMIERKEADMVIGSRFIEKKGFQSTFLRRVGINYFYKLLRLCCGVEIYDTTSGFRACSKPVIRYFASSYPEEFPEPESIITLKMERFKIAEVPVIMEERNGGISSIRSLKSIYYMIEVTLAILLARVKPSKRKCYGGSQIW